MLHSISNEITINDFKLSIFFYLIENGIFEINKSSFENIRSKQI